MNTLFSTLFSQDKSVIIGAIHLPPLLGYDGFPGIDRTIEDALADLESFEKGGVSGLIFENNYDIPHTEIVNPGTIACMTIVGREIQKKSSLPLGISVLWNDYRTALSLAKVLDLQFIRIPVFVDRVKTSYGIIEGHADEINAFRTSIGAKDVGLFTDVHVKHAKLLSQLTLEESCTMAREKGSDAVIITGSWTGNAPDIEKLRRARSSLGDFPILVGSGVDKTNASKLFSIANGAIVSTSVKEGEADINNVNIKAWTERISLRKVKQLTGC